ncbi:MULTISPECIES: ABC transporter substrate-binding protein [unclassified Nostoc]|uniref:ABC transporter substrate-binding protein n=1 Tax=unclassified Nostoc TaxID=2593658 RepID=UPI0025AB52F3|nr:MULTISPECIES: ABC transporter substrate-binding protein [unclassified Nostoc]MDM9582615.1 ABC transporter substrate-binding protein [Nostoc sp. GT001]MDZ7943935.1 ABC transporter substrate-binding protein [Nostoc sp. EfeVER01]MDZ7992287.1 ABC transporter substrate-binding protein [Nostoc sp. EspVER01]
MTNKKENFRLLISLGLAGVMVAAILWLISKVSSTIIKTSSNPTSTISSFTNKPSIMNLGTRILLKVQTYPEKTDGVKAFAEKDFNTAVNKFTASLKNNPNDPETLIYLNNAKIAQDNSDTLKVAVIASINFDPSLSEEILRGVAQAQNEVNNQGGINGKKLQIVIASAENREDFARLDNELVQDKSIVAAVGVRRNTAIYNQNRLVLVLPVERPNQAENPEKLDNNSINNQPNSSPTNYLFHINPLYENLVDNHSRYIARQARNVAICGDVRSSRDTSTPSSNQILVEQYTQAIKKYGSNVISTPCNLADKNFDPRAFVDKAIEDNASGFLLMPSIRNIYFATKVAQEVKGRKPLFASETMYSATTLQNGKDLEGMVLPVYWHRDANKDNPFAKNAFQLWNAQVNQRTAGAYDALQAIVAGLKQDSTREGLQRVLSNRNFSTSGATGTINFLPSGERKGEAMLVKIERCESCSSGTGYDFALLNKK